MRETHRRKKLDHKEDQLGGKDSEEDSDDESENEEEYESGFLAKN